MIESGDSAINFYYYTAFGFVIRSTFACEDLPVSEDTAFDVTLSLGEVPHPGEGFVRTDILPGISFHASPAAVQLSVDRVARFHVAEGKSIVVQPEIGADVAVVKLFLFGSAFGALLLQRGLLLLHGSAIVNACGAIVLAGHSGSGKSTLASLFHRRGCRVLADDVSAVSSLEASPHILASYPRLLLWDDALARLGIEPGGLRPANASAKKYQYKIDDTFLPIPAPLFAIYIINPVAGPSISITELSGFAKIHALTEHTYRGQFLAGMNLTRQHFRQIQEIASRVRVCRLDRPVDLARVSEVADRIDEDVFSWCMEVHNENR